MNQTKSQRCAYVLDTNVLLNRPDCLTDATFCDADLYIPEVVLVELGRFKKEDTARGYATKRVVRALSKMRSLGSLADGISLPNGNTLKVESSNGETEEQLVDHWDPRDPDHIILKTANKLAKVLRPPNVVLVTGDLLLAIQADSIGILTEELGASYDPFYTGQREIYSSLGEFEKVLNQGCDWCLLPSDLCAVEDADIPLPLDDLRVNEFLVIRNSADPQNYRLARFDGSRIVPLSTHKRSLCRSVRARNVAQHFMVESLFVPDNEDRLVIIEGPAGTGKTLLTMAAGIEQTKLSRRFTNFFFTRSNSEADETMGFLPGDMAEKMDWLIAPLYDNLRVLNEEVMYDGGGALDERRRLLDHFAISPTPLSHMRGRSLERSFIMVEEAQNLTREQIKMVVSRAGNKSTVVLIGDTSQIDTRGLNPFNNGLTQAFEAMDNESACYRLRLKSVDNRRSRLSQIATERFKF